QSISSRGDARTEDFWELRALVRVSDKLAGSRAAPWMFVLGVSYKDKWRLAAFPIAPDRFRSFLARVTVKREMSLSAPYENAKHQAARGRARGAGVAIPCRSAPADATVTGTNMCED